MRGVCRSGALLSLSFARSAISLVCVFALLAVLFVCDFACFCSEVVTGGLYSQTPGSGASEGWAFAFGAFGCPAFARRRVALL